MLTTTVREEFAGVAGSRVRFEEPMRLHTSFHIGGPAEIWAEPKDREELTRLLEVADQASLPVTVVGAGANLLVRDSGLPGLVISLNAPAFRRVAVDGATVTVGAGVGLDRVVALTREAGLAGCEFLAGIPGKVGGAVRMNAGTRGPSTRPPASLRVVPSERSESRDGVEGFRAMSDVVTEVAVLRRGGELSVLLPEALGFRYRHTDLSSEIVLEATLALTPCPPEAIAQRIAALMAYKRATQDLSAPSAGCIFKNPGNGLPAASWLIDRAGLKGLRVGDALVSPRHANFIVNTGEARAQDVLALISAIQYKVLQEHGLALELEVQVLPP